MEPDGDELVDEEEIGAPPRRWVRPLAALVVVALVAASGAAIWARNQPPEQRWCPGAGALDSPIASSPRAAVAAWLARGGAQDARSITAHGSTGSNASAPSLADFQARPNGLWEWRYSPTGVFQLEVARTDVTGGAAAGWSVTGFAACAVGHQDVQGPSTGG